MLIMVPLAAPLLGLLWYYTVSPVVFIMQTWTVFHTYRLFPIHTVISYFSFLYCLFLTHGLGVCWGVWCAISGIIKLTINDFCSQTNTCVTQWAAVSDVVHISYVLCPYGSVLTVSLCMKSFTVCFCRLLSHPTSLSTFYVNANMHTLHTKAHACSHTNTVNILYTLSSLNPTIFFVSFPSLVCSFSLPFHFSAQPRTTINVLHIIHNSKETHTSMHTQGS